VLPHPAWSECALPRCPESSHAQNLFEFPNRQTCVALAALVRPAFMRMDALAMTILNRLQRKRVPISARRLFEAVFQTTTFLGLAALAVAAFTLSLYLDQQHARTIENARVTAANLTRAFEQHIVRSIKSVDQALLFVRTQYEIDPRGFDVDSWASHDYYLSDLAVQMAVIGKDGMMVASNMASTGKIDLSDREHFRVHVDAQRDDLFISKPVLGRVSNRWTIQLTRKIRNPDGSFGGVLVASLDPEHLSRLYQSIDIGASGAVTLVGTDGIIRARGGMSANMLGKSLADSRLFAEWRKSESGVYQAASSIDGVDRIVSYRGAGSFPLIVAVALAKSEVMADYEESRASLMRAILVIGLLIMATMIWGVIQRYRLNSTRENLTAKAGALSSTLTNMQEGILMVDAVGQVMIINDHALDLLALPRDALTLPFPFSVLPLDGWQHRHAGGSDMAKHIPIYEHTSASGMVLEIRTIPLPDGGFVKTLSDITERKHDQRVLERARDKAEAASRARTAFLATMSHEIRTPLSGVLSMVDLLSTTRLDDDQRRYLNITRDSAEHLLQLIDDILDVTKLDAEKLKLEKIFFDLHRLVQSTLELVSPKALANGLSVGCLLGPDVPREIEGDPGRLRQILLNLVGNAIKFTASGHVLLDVSCIRNDAGEQRLLIRVEDTGIGMAKENLGDLFRDFSQLDSSISRRFGGTGLGLAICRKLANRMGGRIWVESELGEGTTFFVELPLTSRAAATPIVEEDACIAIAAADAFERNLLRRQLAPAFTQIAAFASLAGATEWLRTRSVPKRLIMLVDSTLAPVESVCTALPVHPSGLVIEPYLVCARQELTASEALQGGGFVGFVQKPIFLENVQESLAAKHTTEPDAGCPARVEPSTTQGALTGLDVLLAEDNTTNQFALRRILELMGARVSVVGNGREALARAEVELFDVVLMDMMMPELDGLSATKAIRKLPAPFSDVPIVALTANAFVEDREAALAAGMNSFATKPITGKRLLEAIQDCLRKRDEQRLEGASSPQAAEVGSDEFDADVLEELREELGSEYVDTAIDIFLTDLRTRLEAMRDPALSNNALGSHGHALKSSAATLGLGRLASIAGEIELAVRKSETTDLDQKIQSLHGAAAQASIHLKRVA
jgi:signal transduction histidine kinase/CheY-like chemotaxis protein/HPt (histidine-containing phosphotransfer) domain-containing protein